MDATEFEHSKGNEIGPFLSFSDALVASKIHDLGVILGKNSSEVFGSITRIKKLELERLKSSTTTKPTFTAGYCGTNSDNSSLSVLSIKIRKIIGVPKNQL